MSEAPAPPSLPSSSPRAARAAAPPRRRPPKRPWRDRAGRLAPVKLGTFLLLFVPGVVLTVQFATNSLGSRAVTALIHGSGLWTLRLLLVSLTITPAARVFELPRLPLVRRMVGLGALSYGVAHLTLYAVDQNGRLLHVAAEIVQRAYLTIGFVALVGLAALGVSSTDAAVRRMGKGWKTLHRLAYAIGALAVLHAAMQSKADVSEAMIMAGCLVWLLLWRPLPAAAQRAPLALAGLAVASSAATAGLEYGWYAIATRIPPSRVFAANFELDYPFRPAVWILLAGIAIALAVALRRGQLRWRGRRPQAA